MFVKIGRFISSLNVWSDLVAFTFYGVFLPFLGAYFLFWNPNTVNLGIRNEVVGEGDIKVILLDNTPNFIKLARSAFQVPFDLSTYLICIRNRSNFEGAGGSPYVKVQVNIFDETGKEVLEPFEIAENGRECGTIDITPFTLKLTAVQAPSVKEELLPAKFIANMDVAADEAFGAQPTRNSKIISTFIFLLTYGALLKLVTEYMKWFKKASSVFEKK